MSLIAFHRVLIGFGILFCLGYSAWELMTWWLSGSAGALAMGLLFLVLGGGLLWYLLHLRTFLGYVEAPGPTGPRSADSR